MKILIVEDELELSDSIISYLESEGYICEHAVNYDSAIDKIILYVYDIIIVDLNLPDGNGIQIIRKLKEWDFKGGIIIASARDTLDDRILGLNSGADDYLIKPFHLAELNARIKSLTRRVLFKGDNTITMNEIKINPDSHEVYIHGKLLDLTKKEFDLLLFLTINKDKVLSKESIAEHLWGDYIDSADSFDFVYAHIKNLRKKLIDHGVGNYLQTVYGVGYKFIEN
ncbi:MAG TPA: response regulator transcription factor [Bacteroidales bacterium]|nr:response regulator transcription factor [Bacteroidales bacterium]